MHSFLWSGKDGEGKERSERVEAENAQVAKAILVQRGWTNLQLIRDEIGDVVKKRLRAESRIKTPELEPDEQVSRFWGNRPSFAARWGKVIIRSLFPIILAVVILAYGLFTGRTSDTLIGAGALVFIILLFPFVTLFFSQTKRNFARLDDARLHGRWNEVLECVERLKRSQRLTKVGIGEVTLVRYRAQALAGLGKLDEALAEFTKYKNASSEPHWLYCSQLASIYSTAGQFEKALELQLQRVAEKPDTAAVWIDLSNILARRMNQPQKAREALARAETLEISALGKPHVLFMHGVISWRENKLSEAKTQLEQALVAFEPFARKPLVESSILLVKAHLCAVNAKLGNQTEARKLFAEVEKFLVAHREDELLQACRGA